jgi:hypothetical protein
MIWEELRGNAAFDRTTGEERDEDRGLESVERMALV